MSLIYRPFKEEDKNFIIDSWSESFRLSHSAGLIQMRDWRKIMPAQIAQIMNRRGFECIVAANPDEDGASLLDLHGWLAFEHDYEVMFREGREESLVKATVPLVHYIFVKNHYRKCGIARGLFKAAKIDPSTEFNFTGKTVWVTKLRRHIPLARWNPLIARF